MTSTDTVPQPVTACRQDSSATAATGIFIVVFARFHPSIGGVETLADVLAREWTVAGHRVVIVTDVPARPDDAREFAFQVLHQPKPGEILRTVRQADIVVHIIISLKMIWPLLLLRRPYVAVHQNTYRAASASRPWREKLKVWIARHATYNVSASRAVQQSVGCNGAVIPNMYDHRRFVDQRLPRRKELVFVGRLVSDKGVTVLLDALHELKLNELTPSLTIVGDGPERTNIEYRLRQLDLTQQVTFTGWRSQDETARILNEHQIMVVPSVWDEPFGIVALEGAACGCVVVGSNGGGLPEAIGPCGVTFPNGNHRRLAVVLGELLQNPESVDSYRQAAPAHLAHHRADVIAQKYMDYFYQVLSKSAQ